MFRSTSPVGALALAFLLQATAASAQESAALELARPGSGSGGTQLLYVWDSTIPGDALATRHLLQFARARGFDTLAVEASPVGYREPGALERYRRFSRLAHGAGLRVLALSGYPWFTVSAQAGIPDQPTAHEEGWALYSSCMASGLFDGLLDDSSPSETDYVRPDGAMGNYFWEHPALAARDYLVWLHGLAEIAGPRPHVQAVPMWFDDHPALASMFLEGETSPHPLAWYVARHVDVVNVLAYRDLAVEILAGVRGELALGPVLIGVETSDLGPDMDHATFFEEGRDFLERQLVKVWLAVRTERGFRGFAVHHYESLRTLRQRNQGPGRAR